jgi:hypothetical protein
MHGTYDTTYLLLYVNDIILTTSSLTLLERVLIALSGEFSMTDLGDLHHLRDLDVTLMGCFSPKLSMLSRFLSVLV